MNTVPSHTDQKMRSPWCALSLLLFELCLNPLIITLEQNLTGIQIGSRRTKATVVAYADDVAVFVTSPAYIPKIQNALTCYAASSGARVNVEKSKAIAFGTWDTSTKIMDIPYHTEITILGFLVTATVRESAWKIGPERQYLCAHKPRMRTIGN